MQLDALAPRHPGHAVDDELISRDDRVAAVARLLDGRESPDLRRALERKTTTLELTPDGEADRSGVHASLFCLLASSGSIREFLDCREGISPIGGFRCFRVASTLRYRNVVSMRNSKSFREASTMNKPTILALALLSVLA